MLGSSQMMTVSPALHCFAKFNSTSVEGRRPLSRELRGEIRGRTSVLHLSSRVFVGSAEYLLRHVPPENVISVGPRNPARRNSARLTPIQFTR